MSKKQKKAFDQVQHAFTIAILNNVTLEGIYLNIIMVIYEKLTANTTLNRKSLIISSVYRRSRQGCPLSRLLFSIILEVLATTIRQQKEIR